MKTNFIVFSFFLILFSGCSKDDDSPKPEEEQEMEIPADEKFLNNVNGEILVEYSEAGNIERMKISNQILYVYAYENERISSVEIYGSGGNINILFTYDANGRIDSFSNDDVVTDVIFNEANNYYLYQKENGDEITVFMNENGDPSKIMEYDNEYEETTTTNYFYEDAIYNGTLTNTNNPIIHSIIAYPEFGIFFSLYNLSKKPLKTLAGEFGIFDFENIFDDQNFLETSTVMIEEATTFTFNYIQL